MWKTIKVEKKLKSVLYFAHMDDFSIYKQWRKFERLKKCTRRRIQTLTRSVDLLPNSSFHHLLT